MVEVLERPITRFTPHIVVPADPFERWHDETKGFVMRDILIFDKKGQEMTYGESVTAETGFKASILAWDRIRKNINKTS